MKRCRNPSTIGWCVERAMPRGFIAVLFRPPLGIFPSTTLGRGITTARLTALVAEPQKLGLLLMPHPGRVHDVG